MRFATEDELVVALAAGLRTIFPGFDRVEVEVPSRLGIADLVAVRTNRTRLERRLGSELPAVLMPGAAQLLSALRSTQPMAEESLFRAAGVERRYGRRLVRDLAASGHLAGSDAAWSLCPDLLDPYDEIIAIEAKLEDWRRADAQAERYCTYADRAFVALPADRVGTGTVDFFRRGRIGLIAVGERVEVLVDARPAAPAEPWRRFLVSEVLTARVPGRQTVRATLGTSASRYPRSAAAPFVPAQLAS